jgi:GNAT superfamily N-acetyltransferase
MPEIEVRPALESDIPVLTNLDHSYISEYVWQVDIQHTDDPGTVIAFREVRYPRSIRVEYPRTARSLASNWMLRSGLLVATLAGDTIGYVSLQLDLAPGSAWITDLAVRRRLRRQGIGSALILAAIEWAVPHECRLLIVDLQTKNHPAIRMMQKLGFDFYGYMDHFYGNGDMGLFFSKTIR